MLHVICVALNYWYYGGEFVPEELLRREPNSAHKLLYSRVRSYVRADGLMESFDVLHVGRKNPNLVARLSELTALLVRLGCSMSPYDKAYVGYEVSADNTVLPELQPYRELDPSRLKLHGTGHWDATPFLPDNLVMAYREPDTIKVDRVPEVWEYPMLRDPPERLFALAKVWDANGLLREG